MDLQFWADDCSLAGLRAVWVAIRGAHFVTVLSGQLQGTDHEHQVPSTRRTAEGYNLLVSSACECYLDEARR